MKARIQNPARPSVWLYQPQGNMLFQTVSAAASLCGVSCHTFGPVSAGLTISALVSGQVPAEIYTGPVPDEPVILMNGFNRKELDQFLAVLRKQCAADETPPVALKAIVTPTNRGWVFSDLAAELLKEHELMHKSKD